MKQHLLDWGAMAYDDNRGTGGQALVLLHGTYCDAADWDAVAAHLPPGLRVLNLEFRGHGQSAVPAQPFSMADLAADVVALIRHCGVRQAVLAGHSLGGMVGMLVADAVPEVAGLVLLEGWTRLGCWPTQGERTFGRLPAAAIARIKEKCTVYRARFPEPVWAGFQASVKAFDGTAFLQSTGMPVWEVYGAAGRTAATEATLCIPANPRIRIEWLPDAGHYLPHEVPAAVAEVCGRAARTVFGPGGN